MRNQRADQFQKEASRSSPCSRVRKQVQVPLFLVWFVLVGATVDQPPQADPPSESGSPVEAWVVLEQRPAEGEQCLVCGQPILEGDIVEVRYKGRRFHVAAAMLAEFERDPDAYIAAIQARSALFDEEAAGTSAMSNGWLYFGLYVLVGLVAAATCGYLAAGRGKPLAPWFFAGLVLNVLAIGALLLSPRGDLSRFPDGVPAGLAKVPMTHAPMACPHCGRSNHPAASRCGDCGQALSPSIQPEVARV